MTNNDYMLILGSNVYANPVYTISYQANESENKTSLFTIENCEGSLILTTEIRDRNSELIAKIDRNNFIQINEKFAVKGEIEKEDSLMLTKKEDDTVILNARVTEDQYISVSGVFYVEDRKIRVSDRTVEIDDVPRQAINGIDGIHDTIFIGNCFITLTDNGIKF
jgi:hypothetical protein